MINFLSNLYKGILKLLFFPAVIARLFQALTMDESGYSLKKLGFCFATFEGAKMSHDMIAKENFTMSAGLYLVGFWLIYGGILVGIYSFGDISNGLSKIKGTPSIKVEDKPIEQPAA